MSADALAADLAREARILETFDAHPDMMGALLAVYRLGADEAQASRPVTDAEVEAAYQHLWPTLSRPAVRAALEAARGVRS